MNAVLSIIYNPFRDPRLRLLKTELSNLCTEIRYDQKENDNSSDLSTEQSNERRAAYFAALEFIEQADKESRCPRR
jgi:hypothetical protein